MELLVAEMVSIALNFENEIKITFWVPDRLLMDAGTCGIGKYWFYRD